MKKVDFELFLKIWENFTNYLRNQEIGYCSIHVIWNWTVLSARASDKAKMVIKGKTVEKIVWFQARNW